MHRLVNGVRVELTPEEEEKIKSEWEANRLRRAEKLAAISVAREQENALVESAKRKLIEQGLSAEELDALLRVRVPGRSGL